MNFYRLIAPQFLVFQLMLLAMSLGLFILVGPPEAQTAALPISPLPPMRPEVASTGATPPALRRLREGLLSPTQRPSSLDFERLTTKDGQLWGSLGNHWRGRLTLQPGLQEIHSLQKN